MPPLATRLLLRSLTYYDRFLGERCRGGFRGGIEDPFFGTSLKQKGDISR